MSYILTNQTSKTWDHSYSILSGDIRPNEPSPEYMGRFDEIICDFMREQGVPGAALSISLHGKPIYRQGYGVSRAGEAVSSSSQFRIASISKTLTAIGVMRLVEEQQLSLEDFVIGETGLLNSQQWRKITGQKNVYSITLRHILEHSAGWDRDKDGDHVFWYQKDDHAQDIDVWDNMTLVRYVLQHKLRFDPGEQHAYSNFGYLLLGLVIEAVTGMPYVDYIRSVVRDIGIEDIFIGKTKQETVHFNEVKYYNNKDPPVEKSIFGSEGVVAPQYGSFPMENTGAFGGWVTCAPNLVKILDSLCWEYNVEHILSEESVKQMFEQPLFAGDEAWYGLGLDIEDNGSSFGHTGAMEGTSTTVHHNKNGLTWSLLLNSWAKDMDLDGLIKYALSSICGLPLWQGAQTLKCVTSEYLVMASDTKECVRILLPRAEVYTHVFAMKANGYMISNINVLSQSNEVLFNIVWEKGCDLNEWCICLDVKLEDFNDYLEKMRAKGLFTAFLESYKVKGEVYHVFVFLKIPTVDQKIYCIEDVDRHKMIFLQYANMGYMLKSQSVLEMGESKVLISAVYDKIHLVCKETKILEQEIWVDVPIENFVTLLGEFTENFLKLDYLQFYSTKDSPKISAVWSTTMFVQEREGKLKKNSGRAVQLKKVRSKTDIVFQRHDVTKYGFLFELRESMNSNRPVSFVSAYEFEDVVYFATIWKRNKRVQRNLKGQHKPKSRKENPAVNDEIIQIKMEILD